MEGVEAQLVPVADRDPVALAADAGARGGEQPLRCGRGCGSGSTTVVSPSASSPASSTHDLIWAEATGSTYSIPRSGAR